MISEKSKIRSQKSELSGGIVHRTCKTLISHLSFLIYLLGISYYFQKPSNMNSTIQISPMKCQYHPTERARLRRYSSSGPYSVGTVVRKIIAPSAMTPPR